MEKPAGFRVSVGANVALAAIRFVAAALTLSHAMVAIGLFSVLSIVASLTTFYLERMSSLPPDEIHTYGYAKYHSLSRIIEVLLTLTFSGFILIQAVYGLLSPLGIENVEIAIAAMVVSIPLDIVTYRWLRSMARKENSSPLEFESTRFGNDLFISLVVLVALIFLALTDAKDIDDIAALIVALYILASASLSFSHMNIGLLDGRLPAEEEMVVKNVLLDHSPQFISFHKLRTRQSGNQRFIDFHLQVSGDMTVEDAHRLADHLEKEIERRLPSTNVIIHVEPPDK